MLAYVKGKGWVPVNDTIKLACGTEVRLEIRCPEYEERYLVRDASFDYNTLKSRTYSSFVKAYSPPEVYQNILNDPSSPVIHVLVKISLA